MVDEKKISYTSKYVTEDGFLYEEIYNPDTGKAQFISWDGKKLVTEDYIDVGKIRYLPIVDEAVKKKAVTLPTYAEPYESLDSLTDEIHEHILRYVDISNKYRKIASWYIPSTWLVDKIGTTTYLRAIGDYGTGKSRFKRVLGGLCYKPLLIGGALTSAPIFRMIEYWGGTLVFDEMDMRFSDETNMIVKILNCGNERFNPIMRCDTKNPNEINFYETFSPKVFCTRRRFEDQALESRCITEVMKATSRSDILSILVEGLPFFEEEMRLRNQLLMFRLKNWKDLRLTRQEDIDFGHIEPRLRQDFLPMAMLFWNFEGMTTSLMSFIKDYNRQLVEERVNTIEGRIVNAIFYLVGEESVKGITSITPGDIVKRIHDLYKPKIEPTPASVGRVLRILGLETKPVKKDGKTKRGLVWDKTRMMDLKRRYVAEVTEVTEVTAVTGLSKESKIEKPIDELYKEFESPKPRAVTPVTTVTTVTPPLRDKIKYLEMFFKSQGPILEEISIDVLFGRDFKNKCLERGIITELPEGNYRFNGCGS